MANFFKAGSLGTDTPGVFVLSTQIQTDASYAALWKPGVIWNTANAYQIPSGKSLSVVGVHISPGATTAITYCFSLGYADAAQTQGIGGGATAPTPNLVSVWGDTAASTVPLMGGFQGVSGGTPAMSNHGNASGPSAMYLPGMWPVAAATKFPFARMRGPSGVTFTLSLWVLEV